MAKVAQSRKRSLPSRNEKKKEIENQQKSKRTKFSTGKVQKKINKKISKKTGKQIKKEIKNKRHQLKKGNFITLKLTQQKKLTVIFFEIHRKKNGIV